MSTTDHKRAFRAPTDNDGGFYVHPNSLDDITLSNGTPGLQRIVATNQASAIGPYIVRGLDVTGNTTTFTVNAGEAVFKSGGVVSVVATGNSDITGSGNYLYLSNAGTITREATPVKSDTKLLIDYVVGSAWVCTKQVDGKTTLGHKDVDIVDGILSVVDSQGTGDTTINTTTGITTSAITATTGTIATLGSTTATITNLNATTLQGDIVGNAKNIATLGNVTAASGTFTTATVSTTPTAAHDVARLEDFKDGSFVVIPGLAGMALVSGVGVTPAWDVSSGATAPYWYIKVGSPLLASATWIFVVPLDAKTNGSVYLSRTDTGVAQVTDMDAVTWKHWTAAFGNGGSGSSWPASPRTMSPGDILSICGRSTTSSKYAACLTVKYSRV